MRLVSRFRWMIPTLFVQQRRCRAAKSKAGHLFFRIAHAPQGSGRWYDGEDIRCIGLLDALGQVRPKGRR